LIRREWLQRDVIAAESMGDCLNGPMGCSHTASCTRVAVCEPIDWYDLFKDGCDVDGPGV
jgi:hypothetical protein